MYFSYFVIVWSHCQFASESVRLGMMAEEGTK